LELAADQLRAYGLANQAAAMLTMRPARTMLALQSRVGDGCGKRVVIKRRTSQ
jgi:hypothetical protein